MYEKQMEVATLVFDGCMVYGDHYDNNEILQEMERACEEAFPDLNMKWATKPHDTTIVMPEGWEPKPIEAEQENTESFVVMSGEFEKTHAKIINSSMFVAETALSAFSLIPPYI